MASDKGLYTLERSAQFILKESAEKHDTSAEKIVEIARSKAMAGFAFFQYARCVSDWSHLSGKPLEKCKAERELWFKHLRAILARSK